MFIKIGNLKQLEYNGIQEMAAYGLHSDVFEMLNPYLKKEMHILDFGCGQGAFSQRLVDTGMIVDACDINTDQIKAKVNKKIALDLNKEINPDSFSEKYDMLIALEILEHLQNPWKYLNDCLTLLKDDGIIVLSTPNISNFASRLRFFMRGSLIAFENPDLVHGHITPLSFVQIENMCDHFRLEILKKGNAGTVPIIHISGFSVFSLFRNTILPLFYPFMSGPKRGRALVYILRKNG
ncbi:MAG: methyltransferase domain-containing protein [Bacteroidales bacterium]|nr:methyltransferase domain-containing protein [Bacteroidales bacterium]